MPLLLSLLVLFDPFCGSHDFIAFECSRCEGIVLPEGNSCLIPAAIADYDIEPLHGKSRILDAFIDNMDRSLSSTVNRFLHISQE